MPHLPKTRSKSQNDGALQQLMDAHMSQRVEESFNYARQDEAKEEAQEQYIGGNRGLIKRAIQKQLEAERGLLEVEYASGDNGAKDRVNEQSEQLQEKTRKRIGALEELTGKTLLGELELELLKEKLTKINESKKALFNKSPEANDEINCLAAKDYFKKVIAEQDLVLQTVSSKPVDTSSIEGVLEFYGVEFTDSNIQDLTDGFKNKFKLSVSETTALDNGTLTREALAESVRGNNGLASKVKKDFDKDCDALFGSSPTLCSTKDEAADFACYKTKLLKQAFDLVMNPDDSQQKIESMLARANKAAKKERDKDKEGFLKELSKLLDPQKSKEELKNDVNKKLIDELKQAQKDGGLVALSILPKPEISYSEAPSLKKYLEAIKDQKELSKVYGKDDKLELGSSPADKLAHGLLNNLITFRDTQEGKILLPELQKAVSITAVTEGPTAVASISFLRKKDAKLFATKMGNYGVTFEGDVKYEEDGGKYVVQIGVTNFPDFYLQSSAAKKENNPGWGVRFSEGVKTNGAIGLDFEETIKGSSAAQEILKRNKEIHETKEKSVKNDNKFVALSYAANLGGITPAVLGFAGLVTTAAYVGMTEFPLLGQVLRLPLSPMASVGESLLNASSKGAEYTPFGKDGKFSKFIEKNSELLRSTAERKQQSEPVPLLNSVSFLATAPLAAAGAVVSLVGVPFSALSNYAISQAESLDKKNIDLTNHDNTIGKRWGNVLKSFGLKVVANIAKIPAAALESTGKILTRPLEYSAPEGYPDNTGKLRVNVALAKISRDVSKSLDEAKSKGGAEVYELVNNSSVPMIDNPSFNTQVKNSSVDAVPVSNRRPRRHKEVKGSSLEVESLAPGVTPQQNSATQVVRDRGVTRVSSRAAARDNSRPVIEAHR